MNRNESQVSVFSSPSDRLPLPPSKLPSIRPLNSHSSERCAIEKQSSIPFSWLTLDWYFSDFKYSFYKCRIVLNRRPTHHHPIKMTLQTYYFSFFSYFRFETFPLFCHELDSRLRRSSFVVKRFLTSERRRRVAVWGRKLYVFRADFIRKKRSKLVVCTAH